MKADVDILVIDDEPVLLSGVSRICVPEGLAVDEAPSAEVAFEMLSERRYRLVLSDLLLPGLGGLQVLATMRESYPETPVVIITGYATAERALECFREGAFDVLPKPFDVAELLAVARRAMDFAELDPEARRAVGFDEFARGCPAHEPTELFALGQHAWVSLERNGCARIGLAEGFHAIRGRLKAVELAGLSEDTLQGNECATLTTADGLVHRVWAPLSGTVVETNRAWERDCPGPEPLSDRWLLGTLPGDLDNEVRKLIHR